MKRNIAYLDRFDDLDALEQTITRRCQMVDFVRGHTVQDYNDIRPITSIQARVHCLSVRIASSACEIFGLAWWAGVMVELELISLLR